MKAIIYAGIGLVSIASIYGVTDYYQTQKKGTLKDLYKEEEVPVVKVNDPLPVKNISHLEDSSMENKDVNIKKVNRKKLTRPKEERTIRLEEFSRGRIRERKPIKEIIPMQEETNAFVDTAMVIEEKQ